MYIYSFTYLLIDLFVQCVDGALWNCGKGVLAACELYRGGCLRGIRSGHPRLRDGKWISHQGHQRSVSRGWGIARWLAFNIFTECWRSRLLWLPTVFIFWGGMHNLMEWLGVLGSEGGMQMNWIGLYVWLVKKLVDQWYKEIFKIVAFISFPGVHQLRMEPE